MSKVEKTPETLVKKHAIKGLDKGLIAGTTAAACAATFAIMMPPSEEAFKEIAIGGNEARIEYKKQKAKDIGKLAISFIAASGLTGLAIGYNRGKKIAKKEFQQTPKP